MRVNLLGKAALVLIPLKLSANLTQAQQPAASAAPAQA